ncbi:hypothetical protein DFH06DRAFT_140320 [Mycena polygramma]|nr:hypothetical protein DFH06DRAFT_140320 [Mycena polygramma]
MRPTPPTPQTPPKAPSARASGAPSTPAHAHALRSRWSSSTPSSVRGAHALRSPASPKTFAFARRYFPRSPVKSSAASTSTSSKSPSKAPAPKSKPKSPRARPARKNKKLTVADVIVPHVIVGRPPSAAILASACTSPDVFATRVHETPMTPMTPMTLYSASGQWSPPPVPLARSNATKGKIGANANGPSAPSAALHAAYTTQRSPRRRVSTASNASGWSYSSSSPGQSSHGSEPGHSSHGSESGHSECSAGSAGSALRRKPIPVEMFLR